MFERLLMKIVSVKQMQEIEQSADSSGLTYDAMMQFAGHGIADWLFTQQNCSRGVIGLVGSGNNGGDTIIALTHLAVRGIRTIAFLVKQRDKDPLIETYVEVSGVVVDISENQNFDLFDASLIPGVIILDGILGTGLKLPLRGLLHDVMGNICKRLENRSDVLKIAVDCPSGIDCDTGAVSDVTITADHTLTMAAMKRGLLHHPARSVAGEFHLISIGISDISQHTNNALPTLIDMLLVSSIIPERPDDGHKGTFGTCLVCAGSTSYVGAAYLTGKSAYRAGCGLVHMLATNHLHQSLSGSLIEAVWTVLPEDSMGFDAKHHSALQKVLTSTDSLVIGPGWGVAISRTTFLALMLSILPESTPTLIDADGLRALCQLPDWWGLLPKLSVLTPHPGEMAFMTGLKIDEIQSNRWQIALDYAKKWGAIVVLKGALTVIAHPEGELFINPVSESALATAGSGDVLSGAIGGLMAQGMSSLDASILGVWLQSHAGKIASQTLHSDFSVTATDILNALPLAFQETKKAGLNASL